MGHCIKVHSKGVQGGVTTVRVSTSRQGLRLGLGLARHVKKLGLRRLGLAPVARGALELRIGYWSPPGDDQDTQKAVRPETGSPSQIGPLICSVIPAL